MELSREDILKMFDALDQEAQDRIILAAAASIREQSDSQSPAAVPQKADQAYS